MVTDCMFKQYQINYQTRRTQIIFGKKYDAVQPGKNHYLTFKKEKTKTKH